MKNKWNRCLAMFAACTMIMAAGCANTEEQTVTANVENTDEVNQDTSLDTTEEPRTPVQIEATVYELPSEAEEAGVYVKPIENLREDFIRGVDISTVIVEENSGVVYYNEEGQEQDLFQTLAQNGVNYVRVRVWNDPYDEDGNGYGGGNNDAATAAQIGARAAKYGMKLCVDFHYSDFWADPSKQMCPKAWQGMSIDEKSEALYQYTKDSLKEIILSGAQVGMVQIGNEINYGMSGEKDWTKMLQLLQAGSQAVRETSQEMGQDIQIAVHFTDISNKSNILGIAQKVAELDYDVFAVSYYPFWHGSMENLTDVLTTIVSEYGKEVVVAENSYLYTTGDGDGSGNSIGEGSVLPEYPANVQGQTNEVRDVCAAVAEVGEAGLGLFYWEPAWVPVGVYDDTASDAAQVLARNQELWEKEGSGWASSYAGAYDPNDAGKYYGGSSWDNQALFDYEGHPLESLKVFKYLHCGTIVNQQIESMPELAIQLDIGAEVEIPAEVSLVLKDGSEYMIPVVWLQEEVEAIDTKKGGTYEISGTIEDLEAFIEKSDLSEDIIEQLKEWTVKAVVTVRSQNLLANSSFEEKDTSMWVITGGGTDFQNNPSDAHSGDYSFHFWSESAVSFRISQTLSGLEPGTYEFGMYIQGGDAGDNPDLYIYADNGTKQLTQPTSLNGWVNWDNPVISNIEVGEDGTLTVGASISCAAKGWGTLDDFYLYKID